MNLEITTQQLIEEIERLSDQSPDGFSTAEMVEATGHHDKWCRKQIRAMIKAGTLRFNGRAKRERIDGFHCYVPVYVLVKDG
jgi:hypothetical protein